MGFSYDDWAGPFYPAGMKSGDWLAFYARHFNAVELDTTFYATPDAGRVRRWAASVPDDFRFTAKVPRAITHDAPLERAVDPMRVFLDVMREMGPKLAAVLLQFPPSFDFANVDRLEAFLHAIAHDVPIAVELRNASWGERRTLDLLHSTGCALAAAEYLSRPGRVFVTSDFLYVRWVGEHHRFKIYAEEQLDVNDSLDWWKAKLQRAAPKVKTILGFFNNDYAGYAPGTCNRFKAMLGLPVHEPQHNQGRLFR